MHIGASIIKHRTIGSSIRMLRGLVLLNSLGLWLSKNPWLNEMEQAVNILSASLNSPVWHLTDQAEHRFTSHMHHSAKSLTAFLLLLFQLAKIKDRLLISWRTTVHGYWAAISLLSHKFCRLALTTLKHERCRDCLTVHMPICFPS